ncbi:hypothetical protein CC86DRAFT_373626 [Ophiobolus disseminans]|uniref:Uncharacterized protein n=1 Tax=Ophiobolus disseminans TaxID=1469910 RepID=A0A6A6ZMH5_9PLEO|nr:hypothetical protein CC86DRAFT_373626 [Ophiobolus disseminans]
MRLSILTLLTTLTATLALPENNLLRKAMSAKRDPDTGGLDARQYCPGFGQICFNDGNCRDMQCRGCISAPDVEPNFMICY